MTLNFAFCTCTIYIKNNILLIWAQSIQQLGRRAGEEFNFYTQNGLRIYWDVQEWPKNVYIGVWRYNGRGAGCLLSLNINKLLIFLLLTTYIHYTNIYVLLAFYKSTVTYVSLYQSACMSVSLCVCLFLNSYETANSNELKFWGMKKVLG